MASIPKIYIVPVLMVILMSALFYLGDSFAGLDWRALLVFDHQAIGQGEYWRLLTGHLIHGTEHHLWMNMAALIGIVFAFQEGWSNKSWLLMLMISAFIGVGLFHFDDAQLTYQGFSSVLYALIIYGAIITWRKTPKLNSSMLMAVTSWVIFQQTGFYDPAASVEKLGGEVAVFGHLIGLILGWLFGGLIVGWQLMFTQSEPEAAAS